LGQAAARTAARQRGLRQQAREDEGIVFGTGDYCGSGDKVSGTSSFDDDRCKGLGKGQHCNMDFQIDGDAAKALYENMKDKGVHEECTGGTEKSEKSGLH
jgi:hypothetical protein